MAITVSEATNNGAYYVFGSSDDNNTVYGTNYAESFIFTGKSNDPWSGTYDLSGDFTIEDVSNGDTISVDSWTPPSRFDLSIHSEGNNVILVNKPSSYGSGRYDYSGVGTYNLNALSNGEIITVELGFLGNNPENGRNDIQISAVGEDLFYNYVGSAFTLNSGYYDNNGWHSAGNVDVFAYGGYEYGQHLIESDAADIGLFNNSDQLFDTTKFYAQQNTATAALSFVADNNQAANPITFTFNQNLDGQNDGTATFSQGAVNAFVMSHTDMNMGTMAPAIDDFTPADAKATTHVDLATVQSIHLDAYQVLNTTATQLMDMVAIANDGVANGSFALTGAGNNDYIHIDHLESVLDADLSFISGVDHIESTVSLTNNTVAFTGNLSDAVVTIEGTTDGASDIFNIDGATLGNWTSFDIDANAILQGSAFKLDGYDVTGDGVVEVSASGDDAISGDSYYDLTSITTQIIFTNNAVDLNTGELDVNAASINTVTPLTVTGTGASTNYFVVYGTAGADSIDMSHVTATNTTVQIFAGTGADIITTGTSNAEVYYGSIDASTVGFFDSGTTGSTALAPDAGDTFTGTEVITDLTTGDSLMLGNGLAVADNTHADTPNLLETNEFLIIQGTYSNGVFTVGTGLNTGADSLLLWDDDWDGVTQAAVVLVGVTSVEEGSIVNTSGVLTIFGA